MSPPDPRLPPDPFDDPAMRDFGGPYADRELPSDRWVASGGLYSGPPPRGPLPPGIRVAKLALYLHSVVLALLVTPVWQTGLLWAVPIVIAAAGLVLWCGISMMWGSPAVRHVAIWLELALALGSVGLVVLGVLSGLLSAALSLAVLSMLLSRRSAELNLK